MGLEHVAMLLGMLVAMLLRVDEYTSHAHHTPSRPDATHPATRGTGAPPVAGLLASRV